MVGKEYECFICGKKSYEKGLGLVQCQVAFSKIPLGEKLQEVLGSKYLVLISPKDGICWDCGMVLNWIDRYEFKIGPLKEHICNQIHTKYKKIEVCLQEGNEASIANAREGKKPPVPSVPNKNSSSQVIRESFSKKKKEYRCKFCDKEYASLVSLSHHVQKFHGDKVLCDDCGSPFDTKAQLQSHIREVHSVQTGKALTCISCGFHTTNTEVYCRHICNSKIVSLNCISCNKRYVDSNFSEDSDTYKCKTCQEIDGPRNTQAHKNVESHEEQTQESEPLIISKPEPPQVMQTAAKNTSNLKKALLAMNEPMVILQDSAADDDSLLPEEADDNTSELATEMPEFFKSSESLNVREDLGRPEEQNAYVRCEACSEQFKLSDLTHHPCLIQSENLELFEIEPPIEATTKEKSEPLVLTCKACNYDFPNIELLRLHWDQTGHSREIDTPTTQTSKIKDKFKKAEATFKVVKQNFNIRAVVPGQNDEILRADEDYKDIFVRVSDIKTDPLDDLAKKSYGTCGTCGVNFPDADTLAKHQKNECLTCVTCGVYFYDNSLLRKHYLYTGHSGKIHLGDSGSVQQANQATTGFKCHHCYKTFPSRFILRKHFNTHYKGTEKGACQFCLMEFENKNDIQQHILEVHNTYLYKCSKCDTTFMSELMRNKHESRHKPTKPPFIMCKICNAQISNKKSLLLHNETYHRGNSCRLCGKLIEDPKKRRKHELRHYFDKELECNICKKRFRSKPLLILHSNQHSADEMKFQCEICLLGFISEECFREHRLSHYSRGGRYKCSKCNLTFASRAQYWTHSKTHEVSHPCSVCSKTFKTSSLLAIHRRKHWRVRPYQCPQCPRVFSVSSTLLRHLYIHSRQYPHRCAICKKGFITKHTYHRHMGTVHAPPVNNRPLRRANLPSLPLNATDEDIFQAADTLISDDSIMFNDNEFSNGKNDEPSAGVGHSSSSTDLITNEVVVETTELFDEILH